jgi:hypothetical protein
MTDRIIAIGDVHGCAKALATLLEAIQPTQPPKQVQFEAIQHHKYLICPALLRYFQQAPTKLYVQVKAAG